MLSYMDAPMQAAIMAAVLLAILLLTAGVIGAAELVAQIMESDR